MHPGEDFQAGGRFRNCVFISRDVQPEKHGDHHQRPSSGPPSGKPSETIIRTTIRDHHQDRHQDNHQRPSSGPPSETIIRTAIRTTIRDHHQDRHQGPPTGRTEEGHFFSVVPENGAKANESNLEEADLDSECRRPLSIQIFLQKH